MVVIEVLVYRLVDLDVYIIFLLGLVHDFDVFMESS